MMSEVITRCSVSVAMLYSQMFQVGGSSSSSSSSSGPRIANATLQAIGRDVEILDVVAVVGRAIEHRYAGAR